jgi:hypothetical protein
MATNYYETLVQEDIDTGTGTVSKRNPGGGTLTGTKVNLKSWAVGQVEGSATWNPGSIANGSFEAKDVTVAGAALGDYAIASFSLDVQDLQMSADVTAANRVTVVLTNNTGAAVDLASGTVKALAFAV